LGEIALSQKDSKMKTSKFATIIICGLALTLAAVGCKKKPGYLTPLPGERAGTVGGEDQARPLDLTTERIKTDEGHVQMDPSVYDTWIPDAEALRAQTVYFDFDSSAIKPSESSKVAAVADYLKANGTVALRVAGHCDERGTEEYTRALGERRAIALREDLVRLGIAPNLVVTISYGEDQPAVQGSTEAAYAQNRRGEFIVLTPP